MKHLRTIILTDAMYVPVEQTINRIFYREIFAPIFVGLRKSGLEIQNAKSLGVERALIEGTIYYDAGRFYGRFNASISKELLSIGATFDRRSSTWKLPPGASLPARLQLAVAEADAKATASIREVVKALDDIHLGESSDIDEIKKNYGSGLWRMNEDFIKATKAIGIVPEFTEEAKDRISTEWATNLDLYIKKWEAEEILELRQKVQANSGRGQRAENLVKMIQHEYGVSKAKAKFLARQETSLLVSKMREERFTEIGCPTYTWRGTMDGRERPDHKHLEGTVHSWKSPPVTNRDTGARNNPGEDFGCRCIAIPNLPEGFK